jgi:hypothetical protein
MGRTHGAKMAVRPILAIANRGRLLPRLRASCPQDVLTEAALPAHAEKIVNRTDISFKKMFAKRHLSK